MGKRNTGTHNPYKYKGLAKTGSTKIGVWRTSDRRFPYLLEARIVCKVSLHKGGSILFEGLIDVPLDSSHQIELSMSGIGDSEKQDDELMKIDRRA